MNQLPLRKSSWPWLQSWQKLFLQLLPGFLVPLGKEAAPTTRIIRQTVKAQKKLLALSTLLTLLLGLAEACVLVVIFSLSRLISGAQPGLLLSAAGMGREKAFIALLLILILVFKGLNKKKKKEGFTEGVGSESDKFLFKTGPEIYDDFYADIYDYLVFNNLKDDYEVGEIINKIRNVC